MADTSERHDVDTSSNNEKTSPSIEPEAKISPLSIPTYRNLWTATAFSNMGSQIQVVAASWLMASLTDSPQLIALVQTAMSLPVMMFSIFGGALADRWDRRKLMLLSQTVMFCAAVTLMTATYFKWITPWFLLLFTAIIASGNAINNPSWHASVRDLIPRNILGRAVALNSMSMNLARTLGPAIGGLIVAISSAATAFLVNVLSYIGLIITLLIWRPTRDQSDIPSEPILQAVGAGMRFAIRSPYIRTAMVRGAMGGMTNSAILALAPVLVSQRYDGTALSFGFLLGGYGVGAVMGAISGGILREKWTSENVVRLGTVCIFIGLLLLAFAPVYLVSVMGMLLAGSGWVVKHTSLNTTVQLCAPRWVTARALSTYQMATFGAMVVGSWTYGFIAEYGSLSTAYFVASIILASSAILALGMKLPIAENLNLDPIKHWREPVIDIDVQLKNGPIFVELEYVIAIEDQQEFLTEMAQREHIRKRDGARAWSLWQNLEDSSRWIESYSVPTYGEYIRHNNRRTQDDLHNIKNLENLHRGAERPSLKRYLKGNPIKKK
ncbi:MFS transporter [Hirschia baltica]|uniref:Major facilitator superfamily (MFS) profile domain-containing protein n=1 Tax=Hirschia baltica (strain ATCC 49814 / DSM 5838 / IFAM 1418) TaxID=582402 RepID=C6XPM3_HIRBI|nr:MFS transporter [Hirschia baltica]ACT60288.1 protein of unknown function DUF894 DitE [Hirschia baltica ATCC 49814]